MLFQGMVQLALKVWAFETKDVVEGNAIVLGEPVPKPQSSSVSIHVSIMSQERRRENLRLPERPRSPFRKLFAQNTAELVFGWTSGYAIEQRRHPGRGLSGLSPQTPSHQTLQVG